jgi:FixJ family two-component response regulator
MTTPRSNRKIVILVEPDAGTREALRQGLADAGFGVLCFPDYVGALGEAESDRRFDLLVTAIRLPVGTPHGLSLAAMVRTRRPRLPVILVADSGDIGLAGEDAHALEKPVTPAVLILTVTQLIGEPLAS